MVACLFAAERNNSRWIFSSSWSTLSYIRWQNFERARNCAKIRHNGR